MIDHLSPSQARAWHECPAAAYAHYVLGTYEPGTTEAMALGTLTEAAMTATGEAAAIIATLRPRDQTQLLTLKGVPTKDAERAVQWGRQAAGMLAAAGLVLADCSLQTELRPLIGGVPWVCRLDVWDRYRGQVWDVKTCPGNPLDEEWVERLGCRGNFIAARAYGYQLAAYREAVRQETGETPDVGIIAVGKHKTRAGEAIPNVWMMEWEDMEQLDGYLATLAGRCLRPWTCATGELVAPIPELYECSGENLPRCETCDWCVASRVRRVLRYSDPQRRARL